MMDEFYRPELYDPKEEDDEEDEEVLSDDELDLLDLFFDDADEDGE